MSKFVVLVLRMTDSYLSHHANSAPLRIRVLSRSRFDKINSADSFREHMRNRYDRWVGEEGYTLHETELCAYEAAITRMEKMRVNGRQVDLFLDKAENQVYVFEMDPSVMNNRRFAAMNEMLDNTESVCCVYVGMTSAEVKVRYEQHRSPSHRSSTVWGRNYFLPSFEEAYRRELLEEFQRTGEKTTHLNKYEALRAEFELRCWLQSQGVAAYSK